MSKKNEAPPPIPAFVEQRAGSTQSSLASFHSVADAKVAAVVRRPPHANGKRFASHAVLEQYMQQKGGATEQGAIAYVCKFCRQQKFEWKRWNASKARDHILQCVHAPPDVKHSVQATSQDAKRVKRAALFISQSVHHPSGSLSQQQETPGGDNVLRPVAQKQQQQAGSLERQKKMTDYVQPSGLARKKSARLQQGGVSNKAPPIRAVLEEQQRKDNPVHSSLGSARNGLPGPIVASRPPPKKFTSDAVLEQYNQTKGATETDAITYVCKFCHLQTFVWKKWNASKARHHIVECVEAPADVKQYVDASSQESRRKEKLARIHAGVALLKETPDNVLRPVAKNQAGSLSAANQQQKMADTNVQAPELSLPVDKKRAEAIFKLHMEASLASFDTPLTLLNPYSQNALALISGKGILAHMPDRDAIHGTFVPEIDRDVTQWMYDRLRTTPGEMTMAFKVVTIPGHSVILCTVSRRETTMVASMSALGGDVHQVRAVVDDIVNKLSQLHKATGASICSAAVDHAANNVAEKVIDKYMEKHPQEPKILCTRHPSHCIDVFAKDSAKVNCLKGLVQEALTVVRLLNAEVVIDMIETEVGAKRCQAVPERIFGFFNGTALLFKQVLESQPALVHLNELAAFKAWCGKARSQEDQEEIDTALDLVCDERFWHRLRVGLRWFSVLDTARKLTSSASFPVSGYLPVCQALKNELNKVLASNEPFSFDTLFGENAGKDLADFMHQRFNLSGADPPGGEVGLLDHYQVWCFLVDPYRCYLQPQLAIRNSTTNVDGTSRHVREMIESFVGTKPEDGDTRRAMHREFRKILNCEEPYDSEYAILEEERPTPLSHEEAIRAEKELTFGDVSKWVDRHDERLRFFSAMAPTLYHTKIVSPLLSMKSTDSISVERVAKSLKKYKTWKRLSLDKCCMFLRIGLNLRSKATIAGPLQGETDWDCEATSDDYEDLPDVCHMFGPL